MKIARNTDSQLIVSENPVWVAVLLVFMGLIFLGIGLGMIFSGEWAGLIFALASIMPFGFLFIFVRRVQLIFQSIENTLTVQRKSLLDASTVVHVLDDVERAELETSSGDKGNTYRVTLILNGQSAGRHPITKAYSNVGDHKGITDEINTWLSVYRGARSKSSENLP